MFQKLIIVGHLGRDPEMRYMPSGQAVTDFTVATSRAYQAADGSQRKETAWFKVTVWNAMAEACARYLGKGSKVLVEGRLVVDPATGGPKTFTRKNGEAGAIFEVTAQEVKFLSGKSEGNEGAEAGHANGVTEDEEIAF
jgi:single-strand DNA-binding protein